MLNSMVFKISVVELIEWWEIKRLCAVEISLYEWIFPHLRKGLDVAFCRSR